ncbi:hypothetical protein QKU48_gp1285 [Fadolivirus algeromassiliense]|jgi:hypothetical protein|uniref:Uncharacterized protein n=1 Tax=Fadolivirus FV1/VV64 TaxID=3070911 RepID=A0A7D3QVA7_9VIRU|nr:hypothetical protein QKU48_gp1285 [Fadolivirus algeromassiliense]QKF94743.1 hypothetical protein Fadolivirus_1_1285 [Fadolivirus FV1/VV64]
MNQTTYYRFIENQWIEIASHDKSNLSIKLNNDPLSIVNAKICYQIFAFEKLLSHDHNALPENYLIGNDFYENDKHYEYVFLDFTSHNHSIVYYVYLFDFTTLTGTILVYGTDIVKNEDPIIKYDILKNINDAIHMRLTPCSLGINLTALAKLRNGQYNLFI